MVADVDQELVVRGVVIDRFEQGGRVVAVGVEAWGGVDLLEQSDFAAVVGLSREVVIWHMGSRVNGEEGENRGDGAHLDVRFVYRFCERGPAWICHGERGLRWGL